MAEEISRENRDLLAYACWIMGDMSTRDTAWSDREIEAYAMIMERMSIESKSLEVKDVAKHLILRVRRGGGASSCCQSVQSLPWPSSLMRGSLTSHWQLIIGLVSMAHSVPLGPRTLSRRM